LFKKVLKKVLAIVAILLILASPVLLYFDFDRFSPFVLTIWLISAVYFVFVKDKLR
jgi:hypothetical protein